MITVLEIVIKDIFKNLNLIVQIIVNLYSDKSMGLYELGKELKIARQTGFLFNQINTLAVNF